jgi:hypothetical protein
MRTQSRRVTRDRKSIGAKMLQAITKQPMTAAEVRAKWVEAIDEVNSFFTQHKDIYELYKIEFNKLRGTMGDRYKHREALKDLTLSKYPKLFSEGVRLYSTLSHWQEQAARYRVDDAFVVALPDEVPGWLQFLQGSEHKFHPEYSPVKGKTFVPGVKTKRRAA